MAHVRSTVDDKRLAAQPGGSGTDAALVRAYVSVRAPGAGAAPLRPSDDGFGWHEVYQVRLLSGAHRSILGT